MATDTTSLSNTPQAGDDIYNVTEDELLSSSSLVGNVLTLNVMSNDLGGNSKQLFSIDDGGSGFLNELLTNNVTTGWETTASGNQIRIVNGKIEFDISNALIAYGITNVNSLGEGETIHDEFVYTIQLGNGTLSWARVTFDLVGQNDAPVLTVDTSGGVTEDASSANLTDSGVLSFTDVDVNDLVTISSSYNNNAVWSDGSLSAGQIAAISSGFTVDSNSWDYTVANAALDFLGAGETITLSFSVTATDDSGAVNNFDTEIVSLTLTGTNDAPVLKVDTTVDIIVTNYVSNTVGVLAGNGAGGFAAAVTYAADGPLPHELALGDVNADGFLDIVTANESGSDVSVLVGDSTGGFAAAVPYASGGTTTYSVALGDVNNDGKLDIVTANFHSDNVGVLVGDGTGGFASAATYAVGGSRPLSVALGDVNADGKLDIVAANFESNDVSVLVGDGAGGFAPAITYATGGTTAYTSVALGDATGDGKLDIVVTNFGSNTVGVLAGDGTGSFAPAVTYACGGSGPASVALGDVNGDGKLDIVVANFDSNDGSDNVSVLAGDGAGGFAAAVTYASGGSQARMVTLGDATGDGELDIVVTNFGSNTVGVLAGDGAGSFAAAVTYASGGSNPVSVALGGTQSDGLVTEDVAVTAGNLTDSGALSFTDADVSDIVSMSSSYNNDAEWTGGSLTAAQIAAISSGFTVDSNSWDYTVANSALDFMSAGETISLSFGVTATDDSGAVNNSDTEIVTLTLFGTNDII